MKESYLVLFILIGSTILRASEVKPNIYATNKKEGLKIYITETQKPNYFKDVLPIFTLILGVFLNRGIDNFTNRKKLKKAGIRWHAELSVIMTPLKEQIFEIEQTLLNKNELLPLHSQLECGILAGLDKTDLINYFNKIKKKPYEDCIELANQVQVIISLLQNSHIELLKISAEIVKDKNHRIENIFSNLEDVHKYYFEYCFFIETEWFEGNFDSEIESIEDITSYKALNELFSSELEKYFVDSSHNYDYDSLKSDFLKPLLSILTEVRYDERARSIGYSAKKCLTEIGYLKNSEITLNKYLSRYLLSYKSVLNILQNILDHFSIKYIT